MKKINVAIMIGRAGSKGLPGKNTLKILGMPLAAYPILAAKKSKNISRIFVSTDCRKISKISRDLGAELIKRPKKLASDKALGEDVFRDAYFSVKNLLRKEGMRINYVVLLFANAPNVTTNLIDRGITKLTKDKYFDSAVTTSVYNMWSPLRARKINSKGALVPFVPFEIFGNPINLNCDRDSQGDVYFADMGASIVRTKCLENMEKGMLPQKWMGKKIYPIKSEAGCDIDYEWQVPGIEHWLKKNKVNRK